MESVKSVFSSSRTAYARPQQPKAPHHAHSLMSCRHVRCIPRQRRPTSCAAPKAYVFDKWFGGASWELGNVNSWIARPQGLLLELMLGAFLLSFGFPIFIFVGGFAAFAILSAMSILFWATAAVTALTFAVPFMLSVGALGTLALNSYMSSPQGKQLRSDYDSLRKRFVRDTRDAPPRSRDIIIDIESEPVEDAEIRRRYRELDAELSDFDQELRRRKRRF